VRPDGAQLALLLLLGVAIVAGVQALGNLLVLALLVAPGAAALLLTRRLPAALALAAALAAAAGIAGVYASYYLDVAAGASVALAAVAIYAVAAVARPAPPGAGAVRRSPVEALAESR
jgi:ABC-type Mn2+/Zn2+ transport system permease subunit